MAFGSKTILTTATLIVPANCRRKSLSIANTSSSTIVYIGPDNTVTTNNGLPLYENQTRDTDKIAEGWIGDIYGIVSSGTVDLRYWEVLNA